MMRRRGGRWSGVGGILALLGAVVLGGCESMDIFRQASKPSAHVSGVRLSDVSLTSATMLFDVAVDNPYSAPLRLVKLDYDLTSGGRQFLSGESEMSGTIPAKGVRTVSLPAKVGYKDLFSVLKDVRPGAVIPYVAKLGLSVDAPAAGRLRLPLSKEGKLPVPAAPQVKSVDLAWEKLSIEEAVGVVKLGLVNRNTFALDLAKLSYDLYLGETPLASSSLAKSMSFAADGGSGTVEIPVRLVPRNLGSAAIKILSGGSSGYGVKGTMEVATPFGPMSLPLGGK